MDKQKRLEEIHAAAEALLADPEYDARMSTILREDQKGKWAQDSISGYYWYLHALVAVLKPKKVLELGTCLGTSALFMLGALEPDATLTTVDIEPRAGELDHVRNDPRLTLLEGNDLDLTIYGDRDMSGIDFLFIDTDHTHEQATREWELYRPLLVPEAVVAFDDTTMNDMSNFWHPLPCAKIETGGGYHYTGFGIAMP